MIPKPEMKRGVVLTQAHHDYARGMNSYALFKLRNHAMGQDLVQDTFIKTWTYLVRGGEDRYNEGFSIPHFEQSYRG